MTLEAATGVPDPVPSRGSCFGFDIRSELPFSYLRDPSPGPALHVREAVEHRVPEGEPTMEWDFRPRQDFIARLYERGDGFAFWTDREGWFSIDPEGPAITVPPHPDGLRREMRLWGIPTVLCFVRRGDFSLHASAVDVGGGAIIFAAPGRFGKTTLAAGFLRAGHRVLAEDVSCLRLSETPVAYPGPALLRIRRDVYERLDWPGTVPVVSEPDRVHLAVEGERRGDGQPVPIRGVVLLRPGEGETVMERVAPERSLPDLFALSWKLPTDADRARCFRGAASLASSVPVWNLHRELRLDRLEELVERIISTCR
jgi:hypothetical protein